MTSFVRFASKRAIKDPGGSMSWVIGLPNKSYKPIYTAWVPARLCKLQIAYTRLAAANDKAYQLLAHGRWSPWYSWNIAESGVKHKKSNPLFHCIVRQLFIAWNCQTVFSSNKQSLNVISICLTILTNSVSEQHTLHQTVKELFYYPDKQLSLLSDKQYTVMSCLFREQ